MAIKMLFPMVQHLNHRLRRTNDKLAKHTVGTPKSDSHSDTAALRMLDIEAEQALLPMTEDDLQAFETALYGSSGSHN